MYFIILLWNVIFVNHIHSSELLSDTDKSKQLYDNVLRQGDIVGRIASYLPQHEWSSFVYGNKMMYQCFKEGFYLSVLKEDWEKIFKKSEFQMKISRHMLPIHPAVLLILQENFPRPEAYFSYAFILMAGNFRNLHSHPQLDLIVDYFQKASEMGYAPGQYAFGICCRYSYGVERNEEQYLQLVTLAADAGYAPAQDTLAEHYGPVWERFNEELAFKYANMAAAQGYAAGQYALANLYDRLSYQDIDLYTEKAIYYYTLSADQHYDWAQYTLAEYYLQGRGVPQDIKKAEMLYQASADQGNFNAQRDLVLNYISGEFFEKNLVMAKKYYQMAKPRDDHHQLIYPELESEEESYS